MRAKTAEQYRLKYERKTRFIQDRWWRWIGTWKFQSRFGWLHGYTKRHHFALKIRRKKYGTLLPCRLDSN